MLNLSIAMRTYTVILTWIILNILAQAVTPTPEPLSITSPLPGAALQGRVSIIGNTDIPGFQLAEIWYSYSGSGGIFLIGQQFQPVTNGEIGVWDTTVINDGNYDLHLRVFLTDGSILELTVSGLRVRNSSPVETNTPEVESGNLPEKTMTPLPPTITLRPTATGLPSNPAAIQSSDLAAGLIAGTIGVLAAFALLGLYLGLRKISRRP